MTKNVYQPEQHLAPLILTSQYI